MRIDRIKTGTFRIPLSKPMQGASTSVMQAFDAIVVRIADNEGAEGVGYTVLHEGHGPAVASIVENVFKELLLGEDPSLIERHWRRMWRAHHYSGRGGLVSFAIAAVDTALWDLRGRRLGEPLWRLLGGYDPKIKAYAGNIDLNFPVEQLLEGASESLAAGHRAVKMRLGRPDLKEDVARVAAMREHLGSDVVLLADANEAWRVDQAAKALAELQAFDLFWIEEPITPDDFEGYAYLRGLGRIPIAAGENLHTVAEFVQLVRRGGVDFLEPDMSTCGGITPFMRVAHLADAHNLPVSSHGVPEVHVHLLAACPNASLLEMHAFGLQDFIAHPLVVTDGFVSAPDRPGHGIDFDVEAMAAHRV